MISPPRTRVLTVAAAGLIAFSLIQLLDFGYGRDQGIYAVVARSILHGGAPYRDAWDFKPPGIYFVYAASSALFGEGVHGIRVIEAFSLLLMCGAFVALSRHYLGDRVPGILGAAFAAIQYVQLEFWHTAQPESFGATFVACGILLAAVATHDDHRSSVAAWCASGACFGCATLLKPTVGIAGAASLAIAFRHRRGAVAFLLGAAATAAACIGFLALRNGLAACSDALFGFAPRYSVLAWQQTSALRLLVRVLRDWLFTFSALNVVGLVLLAMLPRSPRITEGIVHVGGATILMLAGVYAQARVFPYHYGAVLPLTALLAGWGFWALWQRLSVTRRGAVMFAALVIALLGLRSATSGLADSFAERCRLRVAALWAVLGSTGVERRVEIRDRLYSVLDYHARDNRLTSDWLARETPAGSAVFVWGFSPELYLGADRPAASRYIYDVPQRADWSRAETREQLMNDLATTAPAAIVVEHGDVVSAVTGLQEDSAAALYGFVALRTLMADRYFRATRIGKFDLYRRAH